MRNCAIYDSLGLSPYYFYLHTATIIAVMAAGCWHAKFLNAIESGNERRGLRVVLHKR